MPNENKILIGGDFHLNDEILKVLPQDFFDEKLKGVFDGSSFNIVNLEAPVFSGNSNCKIDKTGPHIKSSKKVFPFLKHLNVNLLTLANNHILDYGVDGLQETLSHCVSNKIHWVGAGQTLSEASEIYCKQFPNGTVAFINVSENEWSYATQQRGGANPFDIISLLQQIKRAKTKAEYVCVIIHGGHEYHKLPSPRMVKLYRFLIDEGANAVVGHHTHYFGGSEVYKSSPLIYSLGNFVFRSKFEKEINWHQGALAEISINKSKGLQHKLIPYMQNYGELRVRLLNEAENNSFEKLLQWQSEVISSSEKLEEEWGKYLQDKQAYYLSIFSNANLFPGTLAKKIIKRFNLHKWFLKKENNKELLNALRCESHREISINVLQSFLQDRANNNNLKI